MENCNMEDKINLFVPYDIAVLAKENGFDEECIGFYYKEYKDIIFDYVTPPKNSNSLITYVSGPIYQQLVDWFREVHDIEIGSPIKRKKDLGTFYGGSIYLIDKEFWQSYGTNFKTYYEAFNAAIKEAFKLI